MREAQCRWWEKTVEYAFVRHCLPEAADIAPFAGAVEQGGGDAAVRVDDTYLLIEFKARRELVIEEVKKFDRARESRSPGEPAGRDERLDRALAELSLDPASDAHQLVFGRLNGDQLGVASVKYTEARDQRAQVHPLNDAEAIRRLPRRSHEEMLRYMAKLRELRNVETTSGGTVVVAVSARGSTVLTVAEFEACEHDWELKRRLANERTMSRNHPQQLSRRISPSKGFGR